MLLTHYSLCDRIFCWAHLSCIGVKKSHHLRSMWDSLFNVLYSLPYPSLHLQCTYLSTTFLFDTLLLKDLNNMRILVSSSHKSPLIWNISMCLTCSLYVHASSQPSYVNDQTSWNLWSIWSRFCIFRTDLQCYCQLDVGWFNWQVTHLGNGC